MAPLCFVTTNPGKLREAEAWLGLPVEGVALELDELQTTDMTALARHKAAQAYAALERPVLVEDTALTFAAWGALPGPFIKFFLAEMGAAGLVQALSPFGDPRAVGACVVAHHDGSGIRTFVGQVRGTIVPPRGDLGFGWDAIFCPDDQPPGVRRTFGEMPPDEKARYSMRAAALQALAAHLRGHAGQGPAP